MTHSKTSKLSCANAVSPNNKGIYSGLGGEMENTLYRRSNDNDRNLLTIETCFLK